MNARLARNDGFSTVAIMVTLMLSSLLAVAAFATANNGTPLARNDQNEKQAYSAAEAGIAFYAYHVAQDPNYWTYCTNPPNSASLSPNPLWDGTGSSTRNWRNLPNSTAQYSITLVPPAGSTQCQTGLASSTFLNPQTGTFTIRSTGLYRKKKRSIVATFKRRSFVDFLWFTNYETPDPLVYPASQQATATALCTQYRRQGRPINSSTPCNDQQFITGDTVSGPMHTNDRFYTCGTPTFGASANEQIEISQPDPGYETGCGPASPNFVGTYLPGADVLTMPPSNASLATNTLFGWTFQGTTHLHFYSNGTVDIKNASINGGATVTKALPANNVMYVKNTTCATGGYTYYQHYNDPVGCGDVWIDGSYPTSLTVGADNDIIIADDLVSTDPQAEMGLIANGFVRVYHPVQWTSSTCDGSTAEVPGTPHNIAIDAAILSVRHSFLVDNATCGDPLGTLSVYGAIAQNFRGTVGTHSGSTVTTGYLKDYQYDENLRYADPPYFLDPVETSWHIVRQTEQVPAQ